MAALSRQQSFETAEILQATYNSEKSSMASLPVLACMVCTCHSRSNCFGQTDAQQVDNIQMLLGSAHDNVEMPVLKLALLSVSV